MPGGLLEVPERKFSTANVSRRSGQNELLSTVAAETKLWKTDRSGMVIQNPPTHVGSYGAACVTHNPPTYVGSYGATGAVNWGAPKRESSIANSLNSRIGLTQVVDFHDFSTFFSRVLMLGERECPGRRGVRLAPLRQERKSQRCVWRDAKHGDRDNRAHHESNFDIRVSSSSFAVPSFSS